MLLPWKMEIVIATTSVFSWNEDGRRVQGGVKKCKKENDLNFITRGAAKLSVVSSHKF